MPPTGKYNPCDDFMNYAPDSAHPEYTPMRYIRVRFFMVKHDQYQDANFDPHKVWVFAKTLVGEANYKLGMNTKNGAAHW